MNRELFNYTAAPKTKTPASGLMKKQTDFDHQSAFLFLRRTYSPRFGAFLYIKYENVVLTYTDICDILNM